jgi:hypothetical protein
MKNRGKDESSAPSKYVLMLMGLVLMMIWPISRWFGKSVSEESPPPRRQSATNGGALKDGPMKDCEKRASLATPNEAWAVPKPDSIPQRTYWPAMLALGIVFLCFGIVAEYVFVLVGLALMIWSIGHWVGELVDDK